MLGLTVNGVDVATGTTGSVTAGSTFSLRINYVNFTSENVWFGTLTALLSPASSIFVPGRTVRASVVGMFGPSPSGGVCALRTATGEFDRAVVQGRRDLLTFAVQ